MARSRRRPELQREGEVRCRYCGGFYDPALPECPNCGYQTEENQSYATDWRTIGPEECAGGFGGPKSPIQIAAKGLGGLLVGLLVVVAAVNIGKSLTAASPTPPAASTSAFVPAEAASSTDGGSAPDEKKQDTKQQDEPKKKNEAEQTPPEQLALNYTDLTLQVEEALTLELTVKPEDWKGTVQWRTSDQYVAWVDQKGSVTCTGGGQCTITASVGDVKAECRVLCHGAQADRTKVDNWVAEQTRSQEDTPAPDDNPAEQPLSLNFSDMTLMRPGDAYHLVADGGGGHYTWTSGNGSVATVNDGGVVTAVGSGHHHHHLHRRKRRHRHLPGTRYLWLNARGENPSGVRP